MRHFAACVRAGNTIVETTNDQRTLLDPIVHDEKCVVRRVVPSQIGCALIPLATAVYN